MSFPSELRVFISSTFKDLQEERSYLMKHVFPEVRQRCRERGIEFTEIDLRWGLTHEEGTLGRIIRTCFEEIDKCRPFFVGILGSRFGWVPQYLDLQKDPELLRKFPWIEEEVLDGASLLELEFSHAVLNYDGEMPGAFFYARDQGVIIQDVPDVERKHIAELRRRMDHSKRPVRTFADVRALGEQVRADMLAAIDERWPLDERHTRTAAERRGHEAFSAARRHAYIANPENLQLLHAHAAGDGPPLMVVGESGLGKSALLAFWSHTYKHKHPQAFVITHFTGSTPAGGAHSDVVRRILAEIKERAGWDDEIPTKHDELEQALPLWLARLQEPLVLVIDALNQLDERSRDLSWLPAFIPSHIRVVLSATPGEESDVAVLRGWRMLQLQPLTMAEREALVVRFLGEYRKGLSTAQIERIAADEQCASPLFLRTVLEELRLFGYFEELDAHIDHYLAADDLPDLFQRVLTRMEYDFGAAVMRDMMTLIWASRHGLSENELMDVTGLMRVECSLLLIALDYHLMQRDGRRTFFHDFLRKGVEARYLATAELRTEAHARLGEYFSAKDFSERRVDEEPWQWLMAGEWEKLKHCVTDIDAFNALYSMERQYELLSYWNALGDGADMVGAYVDAIENYISGAENMPNKAVVCQNLGAYFVSASRFDAADLVLNKACAIFSGLYGELDLRTASCRDDLGGARFYKGQLDEAEKIWKSVLTVREKMLGTEHPDLCESLDNLAALCNMRGEKEAETLSRRSLAISEQNFGLHNIHTSTRLSNLGAVLTTQKKFDEAREILEHTVAISRTLLGGKHPDVAQRLSNLATVYSGLDRDKDAVPIYEAALSILEESVGMEHELVRVSSMNLGYSLTMLGRFSEARKCYDRALIIATRLLGAEHLATVRTQLLIASLCDFEGSTNESITRYREFLPKRLKIQTARHPEVIRSVTRFVDILRRSGLESEAREWERKISHTES